MVVPAGALRGLGVLFCLPRLRRRLRAGERTTASSSKLRGEGGGARTGKTARPCGVGMSRLGLGNCSGSTSLHRLPGVPFAELLSAYVARAMDGALPRGVQGDRSTPSPASPTALGEAAHGVMGEKQAGVQGESLSMRPPGLPSLQVLVCDGCDSWRAVSCASASRASMKARRPGSMVAAEVNGCAGQGTVGSADAPHRREHCSTPASPLVSLCGISRMHH